MSKNVAFLGARGDEAPPGHPRAQEIRAAGCGGITELHQAVCRINGTNTSGRYVSGLVLLICGPPLVAFRKGLQIDVLGLFWGLFGSINNYEKNGLTAFNSNALPVHCPSRFVFVCKTNVKSDLGVPKRGSTRASSSIWAQVRQRARYLPKNVVLFKIS